MFNNEIIIALVASFLTTDAVIFGQFGLSRPIVCGPIIGFMVGEPIMGLYVGAILELIWINTIPIGATLVPDVTSATIISVRWAAWLMSLPNGRCSLPQGTKEGSLIAFSMMIALPISLIFRKLDIGQRIRASRFNLRLEESVKQGRYSEVGKAIFLSSLEHYTRNFFLFLITFHLAPILCPIVWLFPQKFLVGLNTGYRLLPAVGMGVFFYNFYDSVVKIIKK